LLREIITSSVKEKPFILRKRHIIKILDRFQRNFPII
jgi:hypothetical protein